jgi:hypothetical protein
MTQAENGTGNEPAPPKKMRPLTRTLVILLLLTIILAVLYVGFSPLL